MQCNAVALQQFNQPIVKVHVHVLILITTTEWILCRLRDSSKAL